MVAGKKKFNHRINFIQGSRRGGGGGAWGVDRLCCLLIGGERGVSTLFKEMLLTPAFGRKSLRFI